MNDTTLFSLSSPNPMDSSQPAQSPEVKKMPPRLEKPVRNQVEFFEHALDSLIEHDHQVRAVWSFAEESDLSIFLDQIKSVEGHAGRSAIDPRILFSLWLYATLRGVGSARQLDLLCHEHIAYRWLCGNVSVNHHTLADFKSQQADLFEAVMIDSVAKLRATNLVTLDRVAHDGIRVRASAGTSSFRRIDTLKRFEEEAREQVEALKHELHDDPQASSARQKAARKRSVEDRLKRIREAIEQYPKVHSKKKQNKDQTRVSITDVDSRNMHMADGGFRPAYNVQLSADVTSQIVVGVSVSQSGGDHALLIPAVETIQKQQGETPKEVLADGGFANPRAIETLSQAPYKCTIYAPPTQYKNKEGEVAAPPKDEGPGAKGWRDRMASDEGKEVYKERAATIECVNALARNRGLQQFNVRGKKKVLATVMLFVLVHNMMRAESLKRELAKKSAEKMNTG